MKMNIELMNCQAEIYKHDNDHLSFPREAQKWKKDA